ncbi:MAG: DUF433 domain-containing protein [Rhodothermales bacterium]
MSKTRSHNSDDPRDLPLYSIAEAARYLKIASATLRSWVVGRSYPTTDGSARFEPLIKPPCPPDNQLSFNNLVEAHVLRALRTKHSVSIGSVRNAIDFSERKLGIERLLISGELQTSAGDLFVEKYGQLINLSKSGQLAIKKILEAYLERIERDSRKLPLRLYPFISGDIRGGSPKTIVIDPRVSFGRPTISTKGISTAALVARIDAGESIRDLSKDYHIGEDEVEAAVVYEQAA